MKNYEKTKIACYFGFITQAIAANFAPLLFLTFHNTYSISLGKIALISTFFFFSSTGLSMEIFCFLMESIFFGAKLMILKVMKQ